MEHKPFEVIRGGLLTPISEKNKQLKTAYVTDTRLMGVMAIHAHWVLPDEPERCDFHQFFYIDCEETGLETYKSLRTDDFLDTMDEIREHLTDQAVCPEELREDVRTLYETLFTLSRNCQERER